MSTESDTNSQRCRRQRRSIRAKLGEPLASGTRAARDCPRTGRRRTIDRRCDHHRAPVPNSNDYSAYAQHSSLLR
jgi:hypothetical protein